MSQHPDVRSVESVDPDRVDAITRNIPDESVFQNLAQTFKALDDEHVERLFHEGLEHVKE